MKGNKMALLSPVVGNILLLRYMLNNATPGDVNLRLFNNNVTPAETDSLATYVESTASNYTATSLTGASWTVASGSPNGSTATYPQVNFNFSAADTIYGYFVTTAGGGNLLWAERFSGGPFVLPGSGGVISITPRISLD